MILNDKYLLAGGTLDISQNSEIIPDTSKACQNLEKKRDKTNRRGALILNAIFFILHTCDIWRYMDIWRFVFIFSDKDNIIWRKNKVYTVIEHRSV